MTTIDTFSDGRKLRRATSGTPRTLTEDRPQEKSKDWAQASQNPPKGAADGVQAKGGKPSGLRTISRAAWLPYLVPVALVIVWQTLSSLGVISDRIMPAPVAVVAAFWERLLSGELVRDIAVSGARALSGLLIGGSIGFLLGIANGVSKLSEQLTDTTLQMLRTIPHLAMIPLVILWFGIGEEAKLFLTSLGVLFPIYLNTYHGVKNVDRDLVEMGRIYGMSSWSLFRKVIFPGALPSIFVGLRYALGIMWLTLIVSESIAANSGIGYMANTAREFMMTDVVVLALVIYAVLGKLADVVARALERWALSWNAAYQV
ncbi:ABC transporter permease subunit [Neorhizobium sp. JUb45]|uniref:ABC transporter permease subunit n=1 Tax=unclassified Neorhizobium TaxID=2629175 RepID=UPI0010D969E1|nr:ABC transporter permease subunit [Neorhizobium sp. JUb45]TCR04780.1 sulfonate transport system permease protein [Neorhizobium sp. JUb45]